VILGCRLGENVFSGFTSTCWNGPFIVYQILLTPQNSSQLYGIKAMEEIVLTFTIESIDFPRDGVRKIMAGYAPSDGSENWIYGMKKGLEFISDPANVISEANIFKLYETAGGEFLPEEDTLLPGVCQTLKLVSIGQLVFVVAGDVI